MVQQETIKALMTDLIKKNHLNYFEILNKKSSIVFDDGLREGIAIDDVLSISVYA